MRPLTGRQFHSAVAAKLETRLWMDASYAYVLVCTGDDLPIARERRRSVAVEPMTGPSIAFRTRVGLVAVQPGQAITSRWGIQV